MSLKEYIKKDIVKFIDRPEIFKYVYVYKDLRNRGRKVLIEKDRMYINREEIIPVFENDVFSVKEGVFSVIDQDGDITYYRCKKIDLRGEGKIEEFVGICSIFENIAVHSGGVVSSYLAKYWEERGKVRIRKGSVNERIYSVFKDLVNRGLIPKSGLKYGAHFRVYSSDKSRHSEYLVSVVPPYPNYVDLAAKSRVAHAVRKTLIIAESVGKINYYEYKWVKI